MLRAFVNCAMVLKKHLMILCPFRSLWFPGAGLSSIADVPGVTIGVVDVSGIPFEHVVAGGPAVTGFPAVECVLAVASFPADPGVPNLACGFVAWDYQHQTIGLWLSV
jgi:hypothetical protein